jgi:O-antigen/teichoic acid export membrane protein
MNIAKDFTSLLSKNLAVNILQAIKHFVVARYLGPAQFGILKMLDMIHELAKYGNLGFTSVASREIPYHRGKKDVEQEHLTRNVTYSLEIILAATLTVIGLCIVILFSDFVIILGIICYSVLLFLTKLMRIVRTEAIIQKKFKVLGKIIILSGAINSILTIVTIPYIGIYAVFFIPIVSLLVTLFLTVSSLENFYKFAVNKKEAIRVIKIGFPIALSALSSGGYRFLERGTVAYFFGIVYVGYYGFATTILSVMLSNSSLIERVFMPRIMEAMGMGEVKYVLKTLRIATEISLYALAIVIGFSFLNVGWTTEMLLPEFSEGIYACYGLIFVVYINISYAFIRMLLMAPGVDKQKYFVFIGLTSIVFYSVCVLLLHHLNQLTFENIILVDVAGFAIRIVPFYTLFIRHFNLSIKEVLLYVKAVAFPLLPVITTLFVYISYDNDWFSSVLFQNFVMILIALSYLAICKRKYDSWKKDDIGLV